MPVRSLRRVSGVASVTASLGGIAAAVLVSPAFSPTEHALSNLGVTSTAAGTGTTVLLFNGGLVVGALAGVVFAWTLFDAATARGGQVVAVLFGLTSVLLGLVGVFPQNTAPHTPVALGFYLLASITMWGDAVHRYRRREDWMPGLALGTVNLAGWLVWGVTGPVRRPGLALPELVGAVALAAWVVLRVR